MDTAHHIPTGHVVHARNVARRIGDDPAVRAAYRLSAGQLRCAWCEGGAWYISAGTNGSAARFAARHADGCDHAGALREQQEGELEAAPARINHGDHINLLNTPLGAPRVQHVRADDDPDPAAAGQAVGVAHDPALGQVEGHNRHLQLRSILTSLATVPTYIADVGHCVYNLPDRPNVAPQDAFWNLDDLDPNDDAHMGRQTIVYGRIATVNTKHGYTFINQGPQGANRGTIRLDADEFTQMLADYAGWGLNTGWDLHGWWVISVGRPQPNGVGTVTIPAVRGYTAFHTGP